MEIKPHDRLTESLRLLLKITLGVTAVAIPAGFYDYHTYATMPPGVDPNETLLPSDVIVAVIGLLQTLVGISTLIVYLRWIYRSNRNLRALSGASMEFSPGWAVGWHFVPFANFIKPYQVVREIWDVSHKGAAAGHALVGWWWALCLASGLLGRIALRFVLDADDPGAYASTAMVWIASDGLDLVLCLVTLSLVTRIGAAYSGNIVEPTVAAEEHVTA